MPDTTPVYGLEFPEDADLVSDYPALGELLAESVEAALLTKLGLSAGTWAPLQAYTFNAVTIPQNAVTTLYAIPHAGNSYVSGLALVRANRAADGANTYFALVAFRADFGQVTVTKLGEQVMAGFAGPTFTIAAAGTAQKSLKVNTGAGIGDTTWEGLLLVFRET